MKRLEIEEVMNGYIIKQTDSSQTKEYVYNNTLEHSMFEDVARFFLGYKVKVERR